MLLLLSYGQPCCILLLLLPQHQHCCMMLLLLSCQQPSGSLLLRPLTDIAQGHSHLLSPSWTCLMINICLPTIYHSGCRGFLSCSFSTATVAVSCKIDCPCFML